MNSRWLCRIGQRLVLLVIACYLIYCAIETGHQLRWRYRAQIATETTSHENGAVSYSANQRTRAIFVKPSPPSNGTQVKFDPRRPVDAVIVGSVNDTRRGSPWSSASQGLFAAMVWAWLMRKRCVPNKNQARMER